MSLALWDHLISIGNEVDIIWSRKFDLTKAIYLLNRWGVGIGLIYAACSASSLPYVVIVTHKTYAVIGGSTRLSQRVRYRETAYILEFIVHYLGVRVLRRMLRICGFDSSSSCEAFPVVILTLASASSIFTNGWCPVYPIDERP